MGIKHWSSVVALVIFSLLASGCSVKNMLASTVVKVSNAHMTPWFMASNDTDVMCAMGEGFSAMVFPMGPNIDPMIPLVTLASGMCADEKAKAEELRFYRAMLRDDVPTAQDARSMQKRWTKLAAQRMYFGYEATARYFGEPVEGECPKFKNDDMEMSYLFGMFGGLQAFQLDLSLLGAAGVPTDLMPKAINGLKCVDSDKFWGIPNAVLAAREIVEARLDGDSAGEKLGWDRLHLAARVGEAQGVRMAHIVEGALYMSLGDDEGLKNLIRKHVAMKEEQPANPELNLLDEMATRNILLMSDKLWTENTGKRTPFGKLGTFWDDKAVPNDALDIDDIL